MELRGGGADKPEALDSTIGTVTTGVGGCSGGTHPEIEKIARCVRTI